MAGRDNMTPEGFLEDVCQRNREYYSDRRGMGALKDLQQTFPNPWLYVAELLQNAVDEDATRISVLVENDGSVVFEHNGKPFSDVDVEALCMRGVSSKGAGTVGFMGIGFKSVFRSFERVEVASGPWKFSLTVSVQKGERFGDNQRNWLGAVLPESAPQTDEPSSGMTCRFRLTSRLAELQPAADDLDRILGENETLLALLAWQGVTELEWNSRRWLLDSKEHSLSEGGDCRVELASLDEDGKSIRSWILFSRLYQPTNEAIARFLEHRQLTPTVEDRDKVYEEASRQRRVAVFCELDKHGDPLPPERGFAFALLPTGVSLPFGLNVQADWLLVVSRRDLMQIEGNAWHEEIFAQLPTLLGYFLEWLVSPPRTLEGHWSRGYEVLSDRTSDKSEADEWFQREEFQELLRQALLDLAFLPVPPDEDDHVSFISPKSARSLPKPLVEMFEERQDDHNLLFGETVFSASKLGTGPLRLLRRLGLITGVHPKRLENRWNTGVVAKWLELYEEGDRDSLLNELHKALSQLDTEEKWRDAQLLCLPTESGDWAHRGNAKRFPADWDVLSREEEIRSSLLPEVGDPVELVRWTFDRYSQQPQSHGSAFLSRIDSNTLEDIATNWWNRLAANPTEVLERIALRFTNWVRAKQPQRKRLVQRLLATSGSGETCFLNPDEVLVAEPYAGEYRHTWFPGLPIISSNYEELDSEASPSDWRSFFESLTPSPRGKFGLKLTASTFDWTQLREYMGADYSPPSLRVTPILLEWRGQHLTSNNYKVLDAKLPDLLRGKLTSDVGLSKEDGADIAQWIAESPGMLREYSKQKIAYVAYNEGSVTEYSLKREAAWVADLREASWVFSKNGETPFSPADVLRESDPARPDAPVADLPQALIRALEESGIKFGTALPDAPSIDRLRIQGPEADLDDVVVYLQDAIKEAGDDPDKLAFLRKVLAETNLFPTPAGRESVDRLKRLPSCRVVKSSRGRRSTFGNWLTSIDAFEDDTVEQTLFELMEQVVTIPDTTTCEQAATFLLWVWNNQPEADRVRNLLPLAYQYVRDDIHTAPADVRKTWDSIVPKAVVYIQGKRKWLLADSSDVFVDDLNDQTLRETLSKVNLATPGHLGEGREKQLQTATLLNLKRVSERFRIDVVPIDELAVPAHWQTGIGAIQEYLRRKLETTSADPDEDDGDESITTCSPLAISRWDQIETVVFDSDTRIDSKEVNAAIHCGKLAVCWKSACKRDPPRRGIGTHLGPCLSGRA